MCIYFWRGTICHPKIHVFGTRFILSWFICLKQQTQEKLWKLRRRYPSVRDVYSYKGNLYLQGCLPLYQEEETSLETPINGERPWPKSVQPPYLCFLCFSWYPPITGSLPPQQHLLLETVFKVVSRAISGSFYCSWVPLKYTGGMHTIKLLFSSCSSVYD